jgi:ankyrin repeat protein
MGKSVIRCVIVSLFLYGSSVVAQDVPAEILTEAESGKFGKVESSLKDGAIDVNATQADGTTILAWAVYYDNEPVVDLLLRTGADVNAANDLGVNPLHLACSNNNANIVGKLLKAGANPNNPKWTGETPLMTCANTGTLDGIHLLLAHGADVNAKESKENQTALMWAAAEKHSDIVNVLVETGAEVNATSKVFAQPEPFTVKVPNIFGSSYPHTLRFPKTRGGFSALQFAAQQGDIDSARYLLNGGADIDYATEEEGSALVIATAAGHEELAMFLLEQGADPDIKDGFGLGAIHFALHEGVIILNGAMPFTTDHLGWRRKNMPGLLSYLIDKGVDVDAPVMAEWPYLTNSFLRSIEEASQISIAGATPLLLAAASGDTESMKLLVNKGKAKTDVKTVGGATVFMLAAGGGAERGMREEAKALEAAKLALSLADYDVNARLTDNNAVNGPGAGKEDGRTALHFAAYLGWKDMVVFLAEQGADLDVEDRYGQTPLKIAMDDPESLYYRQVPVGRYDDRYRRTESTTYPDVIKALLDRGAKPFTGKVVDKGSVN